MRDMILLKHLVVAMAVALHLAPPPCLQPSADQAEVKGAVARVAVAAQDSQKPAPPKQPGSQPAMPASAAGPATAQPAIVQPEAPTEKSLVSEFNEAFSPSNSAARAAAIRQLGEKSRGLADGGRGRPVAVALAKGLLDDELDVRAAGMSQLSFGRDVDTAVEQLAKGLKDLLAEIDKRLTKPDDASKAYVTRGSRIFGDGAAALANYRDDRSVDALVTMLRSLKHNPNSTNNRLSPLVVGPLARAVLRLGSHDAVEAAVRQTQNYVGAGQSSAAKPLHKALAAFAASIGTTPPEFSGNVSVGWNDWFEKNGDKLLKRLGKLKEPPTSPPPSG